MIKSVNSNLFWNGSKVNEIYYNHKFYPTVYWNGEKVIYPSPIGANSFIWYNYDPDYGYFVTDEGINQVIDHGNVNPYAGGNYPGEIHSGGLLPIEGSNYLDVPINFDGSVSSGAIIFLNENSGKFEQISPLPNQDYYRFQGITIGSILVLWNNTFTQNDLDILNEKPIHLLNWFLGLSNPFSIIKEDEDKFYPNSENRAILQNINGNIWGETSIFSHISAYSGSDLTVTDEGNGVYLIEGIASFYTYSHFLFNLNNYYDIPIPCKIEFDLELVSGNIEDAQIEQYFQGNNFGYDVKVTPITVTSGKNVIYLPARAEQSHIYVYLKSSAAFSIRLSNISIYASEVYDFLPLMGSAPTNLISNSYYGIQKLQATEIEGGIIFKQIDSNQIILRGLDEYIDTAVSVDGVNYDFSMMMAFSLPFKDIGKDQYLANATSSNGNELFIKHQTGNPLNILHVGLGRQMFQITFDPALEIHALIFVWDHVNQTIKFAKDGEDLSAEFSYVFDGQTNPVIIGAFDTDGKNGFYGLIGEGILSSDMITNENWLQFWDSVKDEKPTTMPSIIECDEVYSCQEYWLCQGEEELDCTDYIQCGDILICSNINK